MLFEPPMPDWHLAEVNIARLKAPIGDPIVAPFVNALDKINSIADRMDGFVWRHIDDIGNATNTQNSSDECVIYNASIWKDVPSLEQSVWGTLHAKFYEQRTKWFNAMDAMSFAMWWIPPDTVFTPDEAMVRLSHLKANGPYKKAFGWQEVPKAQMWAKGRCVPVTA